MRPVLAVLLCLGLPSALWSQDLRAVSQDVPLPPAVVTTLAATVAEDEILDLVLRWEGDLAGDTTPDLLVQAAYGAKGGNAIFLRHWIFIGAGDSFGAYFPITLAGSIQTARIEGSDLVISVSSYRDGDARCCPSGTDLHRFPLK
jgi:hypothetical protein